MDISDHLDAAASRRAGRTPLPERGQRVFLDGPPDGPWRSTVTGRTGDLVALTAPTSRAVAAPPAGSRLRIEYVLGDVPLEAEAEIVAAGDPAGCTARLTRAPSRIRRRGALRVPVRLIVTASLEDEREEGTPIPAVTDNLSVGGALLRTAGAIDAGRRVRLLVECGGGVGALELIGRCLRCDLVTDGARPWRVAITFQDMGPAVEDRLVRLVLDRQGERPSPTRT